MRLWSLHPCYLDVKGLVALWREGLLAKAVLLGKTRGYLHHPQLIRFRSHPDPIQAIDFFLDQVAAEAIRRGYHFNQKKFSPGLSPLKISLPVGQLEFEFSHLKQKLQLRDPLRFVELNAIALPEVNPLFRVVPGGIEPWEKGNNHPN